VYRIDPIILLEDLFEEYELLPLPVLEGKGLHTRDISTDDIRQAVIQANFEASPARFRKIRRKEGQAGQRRFNRLHKSTRDFLVSSTSSYRAGKMQRGRWQKGIRDHLESAYHKAFEAGFRSTGAASPYRGLQRYLAGVSDKDRSWVRSAFLEEWKYLRALLDGISGGSFRGDLVRRLTAYADALKHIFYAGKIAGTPRGNLIDWISPLDRNTCKGCRFLATSSPYTPDTVPASPRGGSTSCRCILSGDARVLTQDGWVPISGIAPDVQVYTHRQRWRAVTHVHRGVLSHGRGTLSLSTPSGPPIAFTEDHRFLAPGPFQDEWVPASALQGRPVYALDGEDGRLPWKVYIPEISPVSSSPSATLYDLTVDEDQSFIAGGLVVHNSNCRCRLVMRYVGIEKYNEVKRKLRSRDWYRKKLQELKT
jgi:hypothetical protein